MPRGGGAAETDAADEAAESVVVTSDDGAPKADAVARDSPDDDDNNDAGADDDDDVSDVDLDDAWVYDEEDLHRAFEGLRALTKAGLRDSMIMRFIKDQCSLWQPGESRVIFVMARFMKEASESEAARAQFRARLLA